jgi:hypothetical protein
MKNNVDKITEFDKSGFKVITKESVEKNKQTHAFINEFMDFGDISEHDSEDTDEAIYIEE